MPKKPIRLEVVDGPEGRFIVRMYADGSEERHPVVKLPRKKRYPPRPYRHWDLSRKKGV